VSIYVDNAQVMWKGKKRFHMSADSLEELHSFWQKHNINKCWFDNHPKHPHYDITEIQRTHILENGAIAVTSKELLLVSKKIAKKAD